MIATLLLGLATTQAGPPAPVEHRGQTVFVDWDAKTKACMPRVHGVETGDVQSDSGKAALLGALPDKGATVHLIGAAAVPYACTSAIVTALREAGYYGGIALVTGPSAEAAR